MHHQYYMYRYFCCTSTTKQFPFFGLLMKTLTNAVSHMCTLTYLDDGLKQKSPSKESSLSPPKTESIIEDLLQCLRENSMISTNFESMMPNVIKRKGISQQVLVSHRQYVVNLASGKVAEGVYRLWFT